MYRELVPSAVDDAHQLPAYANGLFTSGLLYPTWDTLEPRLESLAALQRLTSVPQILMYWPVVSFSDCHIPDLSSSHGHDARRNMRLHPRAATMVATASTTD